MLRGVAELVEKGLDSSRDNFFFDQHASPGSVRCPDVANIYGLELPVEALSAVIQEPTLQAVRLDTACRLCGRDGG